MKTPSLAMALALLGALILLAPVSTGCGEVPPAGAGDAAPAPAEAAAASSPAPGETAAAPTPSGAAAPAGARILFLHHSTGECVWNGGVAAWFDAYNAARKTAYAITERAFPKESPYGWANYPFDYWNIWVKNAGPKPFKQEPTLEMLAPQYDVIVLKHCFPVSNIEADDGPGDVASDAKCLANYKLQYAALKKKMREFPKVRFIVWTGAAQVKGDTDEASAGRARDFFNWVRTTWDEKGDNIFLWDFQRLETEGGLYLKAAYASGDAHPNEAFSKRVAPLFGRRVVDVVEGRGDSASLTGEGGPALPAPPKTPEPPSTPEPAAEAPTTPEAPATAEAPAPPMPPAPAVVPPPTGPGTWVFDNAEDKAALKRRWAKAAAYAKDGGDNVIRIDFTAGDEEDWGEYGKQRVVWTAPPAANVDLASYRYLALRLKAEKDMDVVLTLMTLPDPRGPRDQPHFGFTAYTRPQPGAWKWVVLDLGKLEPTIEGDEAYAKAGKPARPMHLTALRLVTNQKYEKNALLLDDITFYRDLPAALKDKVQAP